MTFKQEQKYVLKKLKEKEALVYSPKYILQNFVEMIASENIISVEHLLAILEILEKRNFIKTNQRKPQDGIIITAEGLEWLEEIRVKKNWVERHSVASIIITAIVSPLILKFVEWILKLPQVQQYIDRLIK